MQVMHNRLWVGALVLPFPKQQFPSFGMVAKTIFCPFLALFSGFPFIFFSTHFISLLFIFLLEGLLCPNTPRQG